MIEQDGSRPEQRTSVEYDITDGHHVSLLGDLTKENSLDGDRGDDGETSVRRAPSGIKR